MQAIIIFFSVIIAFLSFSLTGCNGNSIATSSAGTIGSTLTNPLNKNQPIMVISDLNDAKVHIVSENIFGVKELNSVLAPNTFLNSILAKVMVSELKVMGYKNVQFRSFNNQNVLNTENIHSLSSQISGSSRNGVVHIPSKGSLSAEAQQFLSQELKDTPVDTIILLTQSGNQNLEFDIKCELAKDGRYSQSRLENHLYFYKIYVIDAHSMQILGWITGAPSQKLEDTRLCKSRQEFRPADLNYLNSILISSLQKSISGDLTQVL